MTHPVLSPFDAIPVQRHRRLLLTLPAACALPTLLTACGGGADLSYDTEQALYFVDEAITPNKPQPAPPNPPPPGHTAPKFTVFPPLPAGLTLNAQTGVISGTPTKLKRQGTHLVVATNNKGLADTQVRITVTGRGMWSAGASTQYARRAACIAPLPGGKVLVAGGVVETVASRSAEIYDPVSAVWASAGQMALNEIVPVCTPLRDGRVLVYGGANRGVELYDPVANAWTETGSMTVPRSSPTGCLLPDGKVLVTGGSHLGSSLGTAEQYDPGTGVWTALPNPMSDPREGHVAVLLPGGKSVLLAGGFSSPDGMTRAELYALDGGASKLIPSPVTGGEVAQAVMLDDGSVLIMTRNTVSWRFYPRTFTWKTTSPTGARSSPQTVLLADGRVLRAGGIGLNIAEIYNPDVNLWTPAAPMALDRVGAMATLLPDGRVLMVNGVSSASYVSSTELYTP